MRYLTGTEQQINAINAAEAIERGCEGTTVYWYATRLTQSRETCLMIDDDKEIAGSTTTEPTWAITSE